MPDLLIELFSEEIPARMQVRAANDLARLMDDALKQVDRQADDFKSAMARVEVVRRDLSGNELSSEKGTVFMDKKGNIRLNVDGDEYCRWCSPDVRRVLPELRP